jgi:hypothetical protein
MRLRRFFKVAFVIDVWRDLTHLFNCMKKIALLMIVGFVSAVLFTACSKPEDQTSAPAKTNAPAATNAATK